MLLYSQVPSPFFNSPFKSRVLCYSPLCHSPAPWSLFNFIVFSYFRLCIRLWRFGAKGHRWDRTFNHASLWVRITSLSMIFSSYAHYLQIPWVRFSLNLSRILWCACVIFSLPIQQSNVIQVGSIASLLWIERGHLVDRFLGPFFFFLGFSMLLSKVVAQVCYATSSEWQFPFPHTQHWLSEVLLLFDALVRDELSNFALLCTSLLLWTIYLKLFLSHFFPLRIPYSDSKLVFEWISPLCFILVLYTFWILLPCQIYS